MLMAFEIYTVLSLCYIFFYDWKPHLEPFALGDAIKPWEEEGDTLNLWTSQDYVFRAAPGFARVC